MYRPRKQRKKPDDRRVVAVDIHPDIFSVCFMTGQSNHEARIVKQQRDIDMSGFDLWARRELGAQDLVLFEAGSNSFEAVRRLEAMGVSAVVLESHQVSKTADGYFDNDLVAAERIARSYLTGMSKVVWVPDGTTSERRELLHAYVQATRAETRAVNEVKSYLTQFQIRLGRQNPRLDATWKWIFEQREWSRLQRTLLEHHREKLSFAVGASRALYTQLCEEVVSDPMMSGCLRILGIGPINAFAIVATVGDINRFSSPEKLVNYLALNPGRKQSGKSKDVKLRVGKRGRKEMRCLLIQAAQVVMRQKTGASELRDWGWRLFMRKGHKNVAVAAVARKLAIQLWHLMRGGCVTLADQRRSLETKLQRIFRQLEQSTRIELGYAKKISDSVAELMRKIDQLEPRTI